MEESTIIALISISLVLAFGLRYGFNVIYEKNFINKYKKFKKELDSNLKKRLIYICHKGYDESGKYEDDLNEFFEAWQDYQDNVKTSFDRMMNYRDSIFYLFLVSGFLYFLSLFNIQIFDQPIITFANIAFFFGFIAIFVFGKELIDINKKISKHELEKPHFEEAIKRIKSKVTKK